MTPISFPSRRIGLIAACALTAAFWGSNAVAQTQHPLDGNLRAQIGNGLPIPFTFQPAPNGPVVAIDGAIVTTTGTATVKIKPSQFSYPGTVPKNKAVNFANSKVFQVNTTLAVQFPIAGSTASFAPSGRTGPNVATWCPGQTATIQANINPACVLPGTGAVPGLLRYNRTASEIGGAAQFGVQGQADVANVFSVSLGNAPCDAGVGGSKNALCQVIFAIAAPAASGAQGAAFGSVITTPGVSIPSGRFYAKVGNLGTVLSVQSPALGPGILNAATSYGGPWTAGVLTVSQKANAGAPKTFEIFMMAGSDVRAAGTGQGSVSLVSGAVSARTASGANGNRGWLNMQIKPPFGVVPAMTTPGLAAAIGLIALVGAYFVRKRF